MTSRSGVCSIIETGLNGGILIFTLSLTDRKVGCLLTHPDSNLTAFLGVEQLLAKRCNEIIHFRNATTFALVKFHRWLSEMCPAWDLLIMQSLYWDGEVCPCRGALQNKILRNRPETLFNKAKGSWSNVIDRVDRISSRTNNYGISSGNRALTNFKIC